MSEIIKILIEYKVGLLSGLGITFKLCFYTWTFGILFGVILGILSTKLKPSIGKFINILSVLITSVPVLILLYWLYFPVQHILNINIDSFILAIFCFIIVNMFLVSKIIKTAILQLPQQHAVAAQILGLNKWTILSKIKLPLIFKHVLGPIILIQITMLHSTIFASLINVDDIFRQIQRINAIIYKPIELYTMIAIFFSIISIPLYLLASYAKKNILYIKTKQDA